MLAALSATVTAAVSTLVLQHADAAAQLETNFEIVSPNLQTLFLGSLVNLKVTNRGPDTAGFEVIAWYEVQVRFPTKFEAQAGSCHQVEIEDLGSGPVKVCRRFGPNGTDLPINRADEYSMLFEGENSICDRFEITLVLDGLLHDPSPEHVTLGSGVSDECSG
jgi:hypothetical protein